MAHGTVIEAAGVYYVRYSVGTTLSKSGKSRPVQKTHRLCLKDDRYYTTRVKSPGKKARIVRIVPCKALRLLADEYMLGINQQRNDTTGEDMKI